MKLHCLGLSPSSSCYLLEYKNSRILFDCGIEWTSLLYFLPNSSVLSSSTSSSQHNPSSSTTSSSSSTPPLNEIKNSACFKSIGNHIFIDSNIKYHTPMIFDNTQQLLSDMSTIDMIVISNYNNLVALPYITEHTSFNGKIYATEPTIQIGKLLLLELVQYDMNSNQKSNINQYWQSTELLKLIGAEQSNSAFKHAKSWRALYSRFDTEKCFEKIQAVRYNEFINLYSFTIRATSSGYCLGSCNWVIESMNEKIVYLSDSSVYERYPEPIDIVSIKSPDIFICSSKLNYPSPSPSSSSSSASAGQQQQYMENINELFNCIGNTVSNGGSVLIPVYSCGTVLDLFELLYDYVNKLGLGYTHIYYISSIGKAVLSYADIYAEWLNNAKKERSLMPESPFLHQDMIRNNHLTPLQHLNNISQIKEPCIIFAGHPSCRMGDVVHLLQNQFKDKPKNSIILVESDYYQAQKLLEPFGGVSEMKCRTQYIPIDPRIHTHDLNTLISTISPSTIILPYQYQNKVNQNNVSKMMFMNPTDVIDIKIQRSKSNSSNGNGNVSSNFNQCQYESAYLDQQLAQQIQTKSIESSGNSIAVAHLHASLSLKDHQFNLTLLDNENDYNIPGGSQKLSFSNTATTSSSPSSSNCNYLWGSLSLKSILNELSKRGFNNIDTIINDNVGSGYSSVSPQYNDLNNSTSSGGGSNINTNNQQMLSLLDNVQNATIHIYRENEISTIKLNKQGATIETNCERTRKLLIEVISTDCLQFFKPTTTSP